MHRLSAFIQQLVQFIEPIAIQLGASGLAAVAFLDSSVLSLPELTDALIVLLVLQHPAAWLFYAALTTAGSVAGCYLLFVIGRRGGEAFLRRKFREHHVDRGLALFRRHGLLALIVPAILPPPTPFKIFVLLAGVADVRPATFMAAVALGRGFRYGGEAWLAYAYGERATQFIRENLPLASVGVAVAVALVGGAIVLWRRRKA